MPRVNQNKSCLNNHPPGPGPLVDQIPKAGKTRTFLLPLSLGLAMVVVACIGLALLARRDSQGQTPIPTSLAPTSIPEVIKSEPTVFPSPTVTLPPPTFFDDFDKGLSNYWAYFVSLGNKNDVKITAQGQHVRFTITDYNTYAYLLYELQTYTDVRIDVEVTNQGSNNNNVGLVCRFSEEGWYEFNISSSGVYSIYAFDNKAYRLIRNGGSTWIKMGQDTNHYSVACIGNELTLYINDQKVWRGEENTFESGLVGISASTKKYQPVILDFEWIKVSEQ